MLVFLTTLKPLPAPRGSIGGGVVLDTSGGTACFTLDGILGGVATGTPTLGADDEKLNFPFSDVARTGLETDLSLVFKSLKSSEELADEEALA